MNDDDIICTCMNVSVKDIKDTIQNGAKSFMEVQDKTGAGTVCGVCIDEVEALVNELLKESAQ